MQKAHNRHQYCLCHHCDLVVELPFIRHAHKAVCPRCNTLLARNLQHMKRNVVIYSLCAFFMLMISCCFVFIHIRILGQVSHIDLFDIPRLFSLNVYFSLALLFLLCAILLPAISLLIQCLVCSNIAISPYFKKKLLIIYNKANHWCMPEIFIAAVVVSFVKLTSYGDIGINNGFIAFVFFVIFYLLAKTHFSSRRIWNELDRSNFVKQPIVTGFNGFDQQIRLCLCCHALLPLSQIYCLRCKTKGTVRECSNLQWTLALLISSCIIYIPANIYGIMDSVLIGNKTSSTIIDGVVYMWNEGDYPIAFIIFAASIIIPILKIIFLGWLSLFVSTSKPQAQRDCLKMDKFYKVVEFIGRWSMIDVFVVLVLSALINQGDMMAVHPNIGVLFFALVVIMTMIASKKYDPRLIWDKYSAENLCDNSK